MHLWCTVGTAGELIKVYPILVSAEERGIDWNVVHTGQSGVNFWNQWGDFGLDSKRVISLEDRKSDLTSSSAALIWFLRGLLKGKKQFNRQLDNMSLSVDPTNDIFMVHGDTLSTVLGAFLAKRLRTRLVHIEAGLRSDHLFQPFPEEINRRLTSRFVDIHMTPDDRAYANLYRAGFSNGLVNTQGNTLMDSIQRVLQRPSSGEIPTSPFVVSNIHRYENLSSKRRWQLIVDTLCKLAEKFPVIFATHPPTRKKLESDPKSFERLRKAGIHFRERIAFSHFIRLVDRSEFVITDGGSSQEECFYLGKPCLILRETTERVEGLNQNCLLSHFEENTIHHFIDNYQKFKRAPYKVEKSPTQIILESVSQLFA